MQPLVARHDMDDAQLEQRDATSTHDPDSRIDVDAPQFDPTAVAQTEEFTGLPAYLAESSPGHTTVESTEHGDAEPLMEDELSDSQAVSQLITEWFAQPPVRFDDEPLDVSFEGPSRIDLKVAPPPRSDEQDGTHLQALSLEEAARQATESYTQVAEHARSAHAAVVGEGNRNARQVFDLTEDAIGRLDSQLQPALDGIVNTLNDRRQELDVTAAATQERLDTAARAARRRVTNAAGAGRRAVSAASRRAVQVELPRVRADLRRDFVSLYDRVAASIATSAATTREKLHDSAEHRRMHERAEYNDAGTVEDRAAKEAARAEIPPRMNHLGDTLKTAGDRNAEQIRARFDAVPPNGGSSISGGIDNFIESMRQHIVGDSGTAALSAAAQDMISGGVITAATDGARALASTASTGSLESQGHDAIARSHREALRSLNVQREAARKAVLHARQSGERQLAVQRAAALTRLADMRQMRVDALRETANRSARALRGGTKTAVTFYSEAVRRLNETLERAAGRGPAALIETNRRAIPPATIAVADGRKQQTTRLGEVTQEAARSVSRLSSTVEVDAADASIGFERAMAEVAGALGNAVQETGQAHGRHFEDVEQGITQTVRAFTQPLPVMFKQAIDDTKDNLELVCDAENTAMDQTERSVLASNEAVVADPNPHLSDRLRAAKRERDEDLGRRAQAMRNAWGMINLDENALMKNARGVTWLGGASIRSKFPGDLNARLRAERDATFGGLSSDEYAAIINYLAGRTAHGAFYELRTTVHWYGNEGQRATQVMQDIGSEARRSLMGRSDWSELASDVRDGLHGTDRNVFDALVIDREALAQAYRTRDAIDKARRRNDSEALFKALTPYQGEVIRDGRVVSAQEQLAEFQREFAVVTGNVEEPNEISQEDAARVLADYATRSLTVLVNEGHGERSHYVERTYTLSGPDTALARALATHGPNHEDARAARLLRESERSGRPNLEALENAVIDPRLNPALTPDLTQDQRDLARVEQDRLFERYAELAQEYGVQVEGTTPAELRQFVAGRLSERYGTSDNDRLGARYASSIVLHDRPDPIAAVRYATERAGTDVGLLRRTFGRLSREEVRELASDYQRETGRDFYSMLGVYGHSGGEVSGDERLEIERLLMGVPRNDRERAEVALYQNLQQQRETGIAGRAALSGSIEERRMLAAEAELRRMMGGSVEYDEFGRPVQSGGSFDERGRYAGPDDTAFLLAVNRVSFTADSYAAAIDRLASAVTTIIAVLGAVTAAVLTVVTGGLAAPLMVAALSFGLAGMAANSMIRGGRYGWEEALTDLGTVGVQVLSAGLGAQLGAAARAAQSAATTARAGGAAVTKAGLARMFTGKPVVDQAIIGAITGGVDGIGTAGFKADTWQKGLLDGVGETLLGGLRGSLAGAASSAATHSLEALPVSRGAVASMRAGRDYRSLGSEIERLSAGGRPLRATLSVAGRSVARGGLQTVGGAAERATELAFDATRGRYEGSLTDALEQIGEAALREGLQGLGEGGGEAFAQRRRVITHPQEALEKEQQRMSQLSEENAALRRALHSDAQQAAQAPSAPALPVVASTPTTLEGGIGPALPRAPAPDVEGPIPATQSPDAEVAGAASRPAITEEALRIARPTSPPTEAELTAAARITAPSYEAQTSPPSRTRQQTHGDQLASEATTTARARTHDQEVEGPSRSIAQTTSAEATTHRSAEAATEAPVTPTRRAEEDAAVQRAATRTAAHETPLESRPVTADSQAALQPVLAEVLGERGPLSDRALSETSDTGAGARVLLERADGELIWVRVIVGDTEGGDVTHLARAVSGDDDFIVTLSSHARASTRARALAHDLEALRFRSLPADATPAPAQRDLLRAAPDLVDPQARLSAHDRGRLAELQVLAEQVRVAHASHDTVAVARLQSEIDTLAAHLGLLHTDAGDPRYVRASEALPETSAARAELSDARARAAIASSDDTLRPARAVPDNAQLSASDRRKLAQFEETAAQLASARRIGDTDGIFRATRSLVDQVASMGLLANDAAAQRRAALVATAFEVDSLSARTLTQIRSRYATEGGNDALRPGLTPDAATVLSPRDQARLADLDAVLMRLRNAEQANADPRVLARYRADAEAQATALGLVHGGVAADARADLARNALGEAAAAALDSVRQSARDNPLLRPRTGTLSDLPLLAQQIRRAQEMSDTRLATELVEIAMLRLHEAGATGTDRSVRAEARETIDGIVGADRAARALVEDAAERQSARQRATLLYEAANSVREDIANARERLRIAVADRREVAPGVIRRSTQETAIRREIDALERRASALDDAASRAERIALRPAGVPVDVALAARSDDAMFSVAPRLRHDPDYPGNPRAVRLVTQLYGDSPQFQSWQRFRELYYDVFTDVPRYGVAPWRRPSGVSEEAAPAMSPRSIEHMERVMFERWRAGTYVSETTRGVRMLGEVDLILADTPTPVPAPSGTTRVLTANQSVPIRVRADDGSLVQRTLTVSEAEARRQSLIESRAERQRQLAATSNPQQRQTLQSEINELTARINDVSEALGVAAGKEFAREHFGGSGTLIEGRGAGVPDLIHEDPATGRMTVIECKGGTSELGTRRATMQGRTVMAEQTTPEYLRSLAQAMIRGGSPEMQTLGRKIIDALNETPPNIEVFVVRQPFEAGGSRGAIDVQRYSVRRRGL